MTQQPEKTADANLRDLLLLILDRLDGPGQRKPERSFLTPPEIARLLRVSPDKVAAWIRSGRLRATNVGAASRPRWRVSREDFDTFLDSRQNPVPAAPDRRRKKKPRIVGSRLVAGREYPVTESGDIKFV